MVYGSDIDYIHEAIRAIEAIKDSPMGKINFKKFEEVTSWRSPDGTNHLLSICHEKKLLNINGGDIECGKVMQPYFDSLTKKSSESK